MGATIFIETNRERRVCMKKSLRTVICLMLAVFMVLTLLTACSGKKDDQTTPKEETKKQEASSETPKETPKEEKPKEVMLRYLMDWNGSSSTGCKDPVNNPVAKVIKEKTGVTLDVEYATIAENEKLNLVFASGDMPDIINAPYWGGADTHTLIIKKAAKEGLLLPLDELLDQYGPNLKKALSEGVAKDFKEYDLEDKGFGGKHYVLPHQTPRTKDDVIQWSYNTFVRKDILEALKIDPSSIKHTEDLYPLLKKIKEGNFKDINGKPVIPAGAWHNGWAYSMMLNSYSENNMTEFCKIDGKYRFGVFSPLIDKQVLFMRKLVSEGLFDPEAFRQNDTVAKEKMATGRVAVTGVHYPHLKNFMDTTLYKTNPEMEYIPVGPILDANGEKEIPEAKQLNGRAGTPCIIIPKTCKDPVAAIKFLEYCNSDEGMKLVNYGIEGVHYDMVNGQPRFKKEWLDKYKQDPQILRDEGIRTIFASHIARDARKSMFGEFEPGESEKKDESYEKAKAMYGLTFVDGFRISYFKNEYPEIDKINALTDYNLQRDAIEKAYFAKSDEEALKILNAYRDQLIKGGIEKYEEFINEKAKTRNDCIN